MYLFCHKTSALYDPHSPPSLAVGMYIYATIVMYWIILHYVCSP